MPWHFAHAKSFLALRFALGARKGHRVPSVYTDVTVPFSPADVRQLVLTMVSCYVLVDFLAPTSVPT